MAAPLAMADAADTDLAHLRVRRAATVDARRLGRLLAHPEWLGRMVESEREGTRRVEADLAFSIGAERRRVTFSKAAFIDLAVDATDLGCVGEISWRASTFAPLFPVFAGRLEVEPGALVLDGYYAPPAGGVGVIVDRVFLRYFAERTGGWFLDRLADAASA
jgi:hypothetical protein